MVYIKKTQLRWIMLNLLTCEFEYGLSKCVPIECIVFEYACSDVKVGGEAGAGKALYHVKFYVEIM